MKQVPLQKFVACCLSTLLLAMPLVWAARPVPAKPPVYVLVHGAWHGGWCWQQVSAQLRATGTLVYTPSLSGMGEHVNTLTSAVDLNTHITDIVNLLIQEDLHDVVLVGHSYGGAVISGVADRVPARLRHVVFLDAVLVENGESMFAVHPKQLQDLMGKISLKDHGLTLPSPLVVEKL